MDVTAIIIAVSGLLTTLAAPLLASHVSARRQREAWQRDQRLAAYSDAMAHVQLLDTFIRNSDDPYGTSRPARPESLPQVEVVTARMRLMAPEHIFTAWDRLREEEERLYYEAWEYGSATPLADYVDVEPARKRLHEFYQAMKGAV